jgi:hypothetical protein
MALSTTVQFPQNFIDKVGPPISAAFLNMLDMAQANNLSRYGVDPTGSSDSTTGIQNALNSLGVLGGTVVLPPGRFKVNNPLTVPANVGIQAAYPLAGVNGPGNNTGYNYNLMSSIQLSGAATITLSSGSGLAGLLLTLQGLGPAFPQANTSNYAGTAVIYNGDDCYVMWSRILGFTLAVSSNGFARPRFRDIRIDCTNGLNVQNCFDVGVMEDVICQPIVTVGGGQAGRSGTAFLLNNCDFFTPTRCGEFGYQTGFDIESSSTVTLLECWCDNSVVGTPTSTGVLINGTCGNFRMNGGILSEQGTSVVNNNSAPQVNASRFIGVEMFGPQQGTCLSNTSSGKAVVLGCTFQGATNGVIGSQVDVIDCYFDTVTNPIVVAGAGLLLSNIHSNTYVNCTNIPNDLKSIQSNAPQGEINTFGTGGAQEQLFQYSRGTPTAPAIVQSGDVLLNIAAFGYNGVNYQPAAAITSSLIGVPSGTQMPGQLVFAVTPTGSNTLTSIMSINGSGVGPVTDNAFSFGAGGARWSGVFSVNLTVSNFQASPSGIGFYAQGPVAKVTVTGAKGGNAALASLMAALAGYGLVTDSTT